MAIRCLTSFVNNGGVKYLHIFDDGSITDEDIEKLRSIPCNIDFVGRDCCNNVVKKEIENFDNAIRYRDEHAFGIKLIDIPIYINEDFIYVDSDVMFYRPFSIKKVFNSDLVFMYEDDSSYSIDYLDQFFIDRISLVKNLNAGFIYVSKKSYDIDKINRFLGNSRYKKREWLIEQTAWAYLAAACKSGYWNPNQVAIANGRGDYNGNVVAVHYISTYRGRLEKDCIAVQGDISDAPSVLGVLPSQLSRFTDGIIARALARFT